MRDLLTPLSILALAAAIALHAIVPALADEPAPIEPPPPAAAPEAPAPGGLAPECKVIRLGTTREIEKVMGELHASGRTQMLTLGSGMICGWR